MSPARGVWVQRPTIPPEALKRAVAARCDAWIAEVLVPRHLPAIRPHAEFNYCIGLHGARRGNSYRFLKRWRTGTSRVPVEQWDSPWCRLQHFSPGRFDVGWMRHTGQWWTLRERLTLDEAMAYLAEEPVLQPIV
ncbi:MAG: hypothetical protein K2X74_21905 [Acetobacteraceae bacterium]|nr:hypothetical protein [Acetobacteraceae bacterium]